MYGEEKKWLGLAWTAWGRVETVGLLKRGFLLDVAVVFAGMHMGGGGHVCGSEKQALYGSEQAGLDGLKGYLREVQVVARAWCLCMGSQLLCVWRHELMVPRLNNGCEGMLV